MSEQYHVRISKDYLVFSSGHFITFGDGICERIHGHNYRVTAEASGPLDKNHYVIDFVAFREVLREIVDQLDHFMLLPTEHPQIRVQADETSVEVTFEERRWVFPRCDCVLLPMANTTSELLARYIGRRALDALEERTGVRPAHLRIEVDECEGQVAICDLDNE